MRKLEESVMPRRLGTASGLGNGCRDSGMGETKWRADAAHMGTCRLLLSKGTDLANAAGFRRHSGLEDLCGSTPGEGVMSQSTPLVHCVVDPGKYPGCPSLTIMAPVGSGQCWAGAAGLGDLGAAWDYVAGAKRPVGVTGVVRVPH